MSIYMSCNCAFPLSLALFRSFASFYCVFPMNLFILFFAVLIQYWMNLWEYRDVELHLLVGTYVWWILWSCDNLHKLTHTYTIHCVHTGAKKRAKREPKKLFDGKLSFVSDDTPKRSDNIFPLYLTKTSGLVLCNVLCDRIFFSHSIM